MKSGFIFYLKRYLNLQDSICLAQIGCCVLLAGLGATATAQSDLSDWSVSGRKNSMRFYSSYGVNEAIEPRLDISDKALFDRVSPLIDARNPQAALQVLRSELRPDSNPAFHFLAGNLAYESGDFESSERHLNAAIEKLPDFRRAHRTLALISFQRSLYSEAAVRALKVIELGGGDAQSYGLLAYSYLKLEKYFAALKAYENALMHDPDSYDFRQGQAQCLLKTGQTSLAIAAFDELLTRNPRQKDLWLQQSNACFDAGDKPRAIANLTILESLGLADWQTRMTLGNLYMGESLDHLAYETYMQALKSAGPSLTVDELSKPLTYLIQRGNIDESRKFLTEVRNYLNRRNPTPEVLGIDLLDARLALESDEIQRALDILKPLVQKYPVNGTALILYGRSLQANGDFDQARIYFERATHLPDFSYDAYLALARLQVGTREYRKALESLQSARQIQSTPYVDKLIDAIRSAIQSLN